MASIIQAIIAISDGTAEASVRNEDIDNIVWENGTTPIPKADIETKLAELQAAEDAAKAQKPIDKASGNQKLLDLGLSQAEVDAITK